MSSLQEQLVPQLSVSDITLSGDPEVTLGATLGVTLGVTPGGDQPGDSSIEQTDEKEKIEEKKIKTVVINVTDGSSFDKAFRAYKVKERSVRTFSAQSLNEIHRALTVTPEERSKATPSFSINVTALCAEIDIVGFCYTTLNFECCSAYCGHQIGAPLSTFVPTLAPIPAVPTLAGCGPENGSTCSHKEDMNYFINGDTTLSVVPFIVFMLKQGAQVICSDFSLKALIASWDPKLFGAACPFTNVNTTVGQVRVRYGIDACKASVFPQMASLAQMALPDRSDKIPDAASVGTSDGSSSSEDTKAEKVDSDRETTGEVPISSITMEAMGSTIVFGIVKDVDPSLKIDVLSVAVGKVSGVRETRPTAPLSPTSPLTAIGKRSKTDKPIKSKQADLLTVSPFPALAPQKLKRQNAFVADPIDPVTGKVHLIQSSLSFLSASSAGITSIGVPIKVDTKTDAETDVTTEQKLDDLPLFLPPLPSQLLPDVMPDVLPPLASSVTSPLSPQMPPPPPPSPPQPLGLMRTQTIPFEPVRSVNIHELTQQIVTPFQVNDHFCKVTGTKNLTGLPVHAVVSFKHLPGTLVVSSMHLSNLLQVNTDIRSVVSVANQVLGRQRSAQIEEQLTNAQLQSPALLRAMTSSLVAEITSSSSNPGYQNQTGAAKTKDENPEE